MIGRNGGVVTTQGEILADHLAASRYNVVATSTSMGRYRRLADIVSTIVRQRRRFDTLLVQTFGGPSFVVEDIASALGRLFGHRVVFHLHGGAMPDFMRRFPRWSRRVLRRGAALVVPSRFLCDALLEHGLASHVIPNVVEFAAYPFRLRTTLRPRLFWMRSFHPLYNPLLAVRVLARVRAVRPDATLVMAGQDKGFESTTREEAARLGVLDAVRFVGFLDHAGKTREGDAADIFINTNDIDNAPVAVLEAVAMGLPVVATDVGGLRHLLRDGETGLLVPAGDADAMATAVLRLLTDSALATRLATAARRTAEASAWSCVGPMWDDLLERVGGHR